LRSATETEEPITDRISVVSVVMRLRSRRSASASKKAGLMPRDRSKTALRMSATTRSPSRVTSSSAAPSRAREGGNGQEGGEILVQQRTFAALNPSTTRRTASGSTRLTAAVSVSAPKVSAPSAAAAMPR
jgi:hypothetical protein